MTDEEWRRIWLLLRVPVGERVDVPDRERVTRRKIEEAFDSYEMALEAVKLVYVGRSLPPDAHEVVDATNCVGFQGVQVQHELRRASERLEEEDEGEWPKTRNS